MKTKNKTKFDIMLEIANNKFPNDSIKRSLYVKQFERCGYTKKELLEILEKEK